MASAVTLQGDAAEVSLAEAQAVGAMVVDDERRERFDSLVAAISDGEVADEDAEALGELLELGLQTGRLRALYGLAGEQAALEIYSRLPRGRELRRAARAVSDALSSLEGQTLESISIQAVGPSAYLLSFEAGGTQLSVRLDRQGARFANIGV